MARSMSTISADEASKVVFSGHMKTGRLGLMPKAEATGARRRRRYFIIIGFTNSMVE